MRQPQARTKERCDAPQESASPAGIPAGPNADHVHDNRLLPALSVESRALGGSVRIVVVLIDQFVLAISRREHKPWSGWADGISSRFRPWCLSCWDGLWPSAQDDPGIAQLKALNERAVQLYKQGEYQKAIELFEQVVKLAIDRFGPDHPDVATSLNNLADLYRAMGRYAEAEPLYQRSLEIREASSGPTTPSWPLA